MWKYRLEHVILFIGMKSAQRAQRRARIMKKRNGKALSKEEINYMVSGYTKGEIPDYQMSAMMIDRKSVV